MNENKYGHSATKVTNVVLVYGGALSAKTRPKLLNDVLQLASETKTWEVLQCDNTLSPRYFHSAVAYKNSLFIFGGKTEHGYSNDLHEFNTQTKIWTKIEQKNTKKKPTPRYGHASVACGREMFTFGGCDINGEIDNNLYIFDLITHEWKQKKHIPSVPKSYHHTLVFDEGGYLYILGGRTNKQQALTNVTKINPISFSVERCPSLPTPRYGHISFFKNGELTVLGGCDFEKDYNSGYKLVKDKWEETLCEHFEHGSVFSSVVIVNDEEMLVGGTRKNKPNDTIFDRYTAHLGDSVLHILQYLPLNDIQSIRATSKHWNVAIYARCNKESIFTNTCR
jgi:N-acetylneuraminic acid mutarotase